MSGSILSINSNTSSLRAQRALGATTVSLSASFEKLSSGLRINKASDDAAGLAVASSLRADTRIYVQGVRNLNDGVSALNIADGALSNLSSIVTRLEELSEQSANGAVGSKQRKSLDAEAQALAKEYFRISRTTDFNGLKLLDGTIQGLSLQSGYGSGGSILSSLGGALGTGTFLTSTSYETNSGVRALAAADLNGDGAPDLVMTGGNRATIHLGNGDGTFKAPVSYQAESNSSYALSLSDVNGDGRLDLLTAGDGTGAKAYATIRLGKGDGTFGAALSYQTDTGAFSTSFALALSDLNGDGALDLITTGSDIGTGRTTIRLGNGDGTFRASASYQAEASFSRALAIADLNGDGMMDLATAGTGGGSGRATIRLGNGDGTFGAAVSCQAEDSITNALTVSDVNGDGVFDLVTAGVGGGVGRATIRIGNGDGTFRASLSYQTDNIGSLAVATADADGDGIVDLLTAGGDNFGPNYCTIRLGNGDGTFKAMLSYRAEPMRPYGLSTADLNGDGVMDFTTAGNGYVTVRLACTRDGVSPIQPFSLKTQADALQALPVFKKLLERLSVQRGEIGAFQSRLSSALHTLGSTVLEYQGARSRVEDVDVAQEAASLVRQQILQQAASSVVGQANQAPSLALMLLKA